MTNKNLKVYVAKTKRIYKPLRTRQYRFTAKGDSDAKNVFLKNTKGKECFFKDKSCKSERYAYDRLEIYRNNKLVYSNLDKKKANKYIKMQDPAPGVETVLVSRGAIDRSVVNPKSSKKNYA